MSSKTEEKHQNMFKRILCLLNQSGFGMFWIDVIFVQETPEPPPRQERLCPCNILLSSPQLVTMFATRNKCIASSNKCLTSSNKKLLVTFNPSGPIRAERPCRCHSLAARLPRPFAGAPFGRFAHTSLAGECSTHEMIEAEPLHNEANDPFVQLKGGTKKMLVDLLDVSSFLFCDLPSQSSKI